MKWRDDDFRAACVVEVMHGNLFADARPAAAEHGEPDRLAERGTPGRRGDPAVAALRRPGQAQVGSGHERLRFTVGDQADELQPVSPLVLRAKE